ncbi:phosphomannomutase/phosphoglucomutase [Algimonas porphyrae]|uniref:Phosphomannomutase n=1 Tax=Algimonas porphyrae TaxID=1128113 RepID=A0ABQ5UYJ5_9PROT|nr:phosphomannomutase/phosphoglucomutase [Algimonas porphyrae]GLQ19787.1 phosphomannomutase [Algimonas porphyrae]
MSTTPHAHIPPNSYAFETDALVKPTGFREYDARWWFGIPGHEKDPELNLYGVRALGEGLGTLMHERGVDPVIAVGHDFRHYSLGIKMTLISGLMNAGIKVLDIGLALSPMAYFSQFHLNAAGVAMVTASHNSNGWTGVKMGIEPPLTFGPDEMARLKQIVLNGESQARSGGSYEYVDGVREAYIADVAEGVTLSRPIKVVAACGNGTAGAFAPELLRRIGADVIPVECDLDYTFPNYNPNPESMKMLHAMRDAVLEHGAEVALGFDGDGDRCGVVDNEGEEIFADKVGVMLARDLSALYPDAQFVADVKSTGLFNTDPVLKANGAKTDYYKTGHSYIKRRSKELNALVGFEKSGHYFFNAPIGRGYDCGLVSAVAILQMLDRNPGKSFADLRRALPTTYGSPTMSPYCADEEKYGVVERIVADVQADADAGRTVIDQKIVDVNTVNGVRFTVEDGSWGLIRASSNTPNLVVVVESPTAKENTVGIFRDIERRLAAYDEVGEFDQKI